MTTDPREFLSFAPRFLPLGLLGQDQLQEVASSIIEVDGTTNDTIYDAGEDLAGIYVIRSGSVDILSPEGEKLSHLAAGDSFGERGLLRDGIAPNRAIGAEDFRLYLLPKRHFQTFLDTVPAFRRFFAPQPIATTTAVDRLASTPIADLMTKDPITIDRQCTAKQAAQIMREHDISCLPVTDDHSLVGLLTSGDLVDRVLAVDLGADTPVGEVMTPKPFAITPHSLGFDALLAMTERAVGHLPIVDHGKLVGIITTSNLVRHQALSSIDLICDIKQGKSVEVIADVVSKIPRLLVSLVGSGLNAHDTGRIITSIADTTTRRLIGIAEETLGPAPVPYLWLVCGSQGRSEQTSVSDQDNCLFLDDSYVAEEHGDYFVKFAAQISDGLDACGYYYCPGEMMATNPKWCQPVSTWRRYFEKWIREPDPMAQMLASVMFDLRPIAGDRSLFEGVQSRTLAMASRNSIFRSHMVVNSVKHTPPLGIFRNFSLIWRGEHKDTIDLKLNGVVPIVDLGRVYALESSIEEVNTRERLALAREAGAISPAGYHDLADAFDLIANTRLQHQAEQIRGGEKPDNFLPPNILSDLERNHLRDAFIVVKTIQSALTARRGTGL